MPGLRRAWRDAYDEPAEPWRFPAARWVLVAVVLMGAAYSRTLTAPFVYEDATSVKAVSALTWPSSRGWVTTGRAVTRLSLDANYLLGGRHPLGYHVGNVLLHGLNGVLVYTVGTAVVGAPAAAIGASLFLLHPLQTESVSYVSGRSELLAACFVLLALVAVCGPLTPTRTAGYLVCAVWAMASKETGVAVLFLAPLVVWARRGDPRWTVPFVLLAACGALHLWEALHGNHFVFTSDAGGFGYLAYQCAALWRLVGLAIVPVGFTIDHDVASWSHRTALLGLAGVGMWLAVALWAACTRRRVLALGLLWPLLVVAPRLFVRTIEFMNEHQTYLPFVGLWWLAGWSAVQLPSWARLQQALALPGALRGQWRAQC